MSEFLNDIEPDSGPVGPLPPPPSRYDIWRRRLINPPTGDLFARYLIMSGVVRFLVEGIRRNPAWILGLTTAQCISVGMIVFGVMLLRRIGAPAASSGAEMEPPGSVAGTESAA